MSETTNILKMSLLQIVSRFLKGLYSASQYNSYYGIKKEFELRWYKINRREINEIQVTADKLLRDQVYNVK
jgi:hypothetical protein